MSRCRSVRRVRLADVPRASGDEPQSLAPVVEVLACSPRERG